MEITSNSILQYLSSDGVNGKQYDLTTVFKKELSEPQKNALRNLLQELHAKQYLHVSGDYLLLAGKRAGLPYPLRELNIKIMLKQDGYNFIQEQKIQNINLLKRMNSIQMEMADLLLKILVEHKGTLNTDQQSYFFTEEKNYEWFEFTLMRDNLIDEGLISWWGDEKYRIKLTQDGWKAAEMGLEKYWQQKEQKTNPKKTVKQSEKLDLILKGLYELKHDGKYYSLTWLLQNDGIETNFDELFSLGKKLEADGLIKFNGRHDDVMACITAVGIEYVEEDSYSFKGKSITTNNYNITIQGHGNVVGLGNIENNIIANTIKFTDVDLKEAFEKLTAIIKNSIEVSEEQKEEYLEHILFLSQEAIKPSEERAPKSTIKTILKSCQEILTAVAHSAEVWHVWGTKITDFFND